MSKQKELVKNTLIIAFGKLSTQFLTFLLLPLYTAYLTTSEFGSIDLILTYVVLLAPVITISIEMAAFRFLIDARDSENEKRRVISNVMQLLGLFVLIFLLSFAAANSFVVIPYGWLVAGVILAVIFSNMFLQFARGLGYNVKYSIGGVLAGITTIAANIVLIVYMGMGASGMLLALLLGNLACAIYMFIALKLYTYIRIADGGMKLKRRLLGYSAPLVPNGASIWAIQAADRTIIVLMLGVASNGIYAVAYRFPLILSGLFGFFGMSWTEAASVHIDSRDRDKFFSQTINASVRLFGSLCLGIIACIPLIFGLLVDDAYSEAYLYIPILMLGAMLASVMSSYGAIYIAKKMTKRLLNSSLIAAGISVGLAICLTPLIGLYGPAFAMLVAYLVTATYRHYDVKKYVSIRYDIRSLLLLGGAFAIVAGLYYLNNPILNILNVAFAAACAIFLNRSIVKVVKTKIMSRLRPLTPDQQVAEEIEGQR